MFQSPRPGRGATHLAPGPLGSILFQPPPPGRGATSPPFTSCARTVFQSTRPVRGATRSTCAIGASAWFQSTRPVRGATCPSFSETYARQCFNPRAPCGARPTQSGKEFGPEAFQSTRPVRGATLSRYRIRLSTSCFNPRAPCGARHPFPDGNGRVGRFNPRAPCGARRDVDTGRRYRPKFQSTRPVRGATSASRLPACSSPVSIHAPRAGRDEWLNIQIQPVGVSIHAPRAGRDVMSRARWICVSCFNPRAPCGARHFRSTYESLTREFQSTRPVRGATGCRWLFRAG